jgi:hypothetical protein
MPAQLPRSVVRADALAVRAAILAVNGYEEGARGDAHNLGAEHLLLEERALIASLLGDQSDY